MPKALGIDFGMKRTGLAITDNLMMIASPLETVETSKLAAHLTLLVAKEKITVFVLGEARYLDGQASAITLEQEKFANKLRAQFPQIPVERVDEMYTSKLAAQALYAGGMKKKDRMKKGNLDKVSAAIILQSWLEWKR